MCSNSSKLLHKSNQGSHGLEKFWKSQTNFKGLEKVLNFSGKSRGGKRLENPIPTGILKCAIFLIQETRTKSLVGFL
jgi:hypothetical protein